MPGYSKTPLAKKLGFKSDTRIKTKHAPKDYFDLLEPLPSNITVSSRLRGPIDIWHLFVIRKSQLSRQLPKSISEIYADGMIWVSWPKKSSGVKSDMSEDVVREVALPLGIVDIKVCAIDDTWSGLKLVVRRENRAAHLKKYGY